ncbi:hypothetical protein [Cumulibacter soli]|uniref:hypothetical protein n=1 Tax=Cumulibacter soli TaxID=2546344 RepID=UPI00141949D6|nr:hypothetical protein [Cumulibacter soli]
MSEPTPPSPAPPSAPPPPPHEVDRTQGGRKPAPDGDLPIDVRRTRNLYTVVAAFLVFIGVTSLMGVSEAVVEFRKALIEADADVAAQVGDGMIQALLILSGIATLIVAIGHGLTSHAISDRRSWARPVGLTFSGILLGLAALNLFSGAQMLPTFFFAVSGLLGISLINRPTVREYLRPSPPRYPPSGPGGPGGPHNPGSGGPGYPDGAYGNQPAPEQPRPENQQTRDN